MPLPFFFCSLPSLYFEYESISDALFGTILGEIRESTPNQMQNIYHTMQLLWTNAYSTAHDMQSKYEIVKVKTILSLHDEKRGDRSAASPSLVVKHCFSCYFVFLRTDDSRRSHPSCPGSKREILHLKKDTRYVNVGVSHQGTKRQ